jgi:hypothetical protein
MAPSTVMTWRWCETGLNAVKAITRFTQAARNLS